MPLLASTDNIAPKSVLRHRPIGDRTLSTGNVPEHTTASVPIAQRASRSRPVDTQDQVDEWRHTTPNTSQDKPSQPGRKRTSKTTIKHLPSTRRTLWPENIGARSRAALRAHPLFYLGLGMLAMLILWVALSSAFGWLSMALDNLHYGYPRTFQTDAWVGHNEQNGLPSHFIAINLNRHIEVIEIPGGDATHTRIYIGPQLYSSHDDLIPVTLTFIDVNGDHKPDMLVNFQGSRLVYINGQGGFRQMLPSERPEVEQTLQRLGQ